MRQCVLAYTRFLTVLASIWLAYYPGLSGGFLFDDFANLPALGTTGPIDNGPALARYLTSSTADPTGRPITVASFLIDARDWPADPLPFKRTNLLIHLLNAMLLARILLALGRHSRLDGSHARNAALIGSAMWALHPLFVSTTLYIVQREAMLPVSFTLAGLLVWLSGRKQMSKGCIWRGALLEITGLGLGTLFATLSKANGALLPVYALLIEHLLLRPNDEKPMPHMHGILINALWLPVIIVSAYLAHTAAAFLGGPPPFGREWTLDQRLLTEPRVLFEYLRLLWLPHPFTTGLFNDQIIASTTVLHPWTTLPALVGILSLIVAGWLLRKRQPLLSLAILFYFSGHLIESSVIPLELYFEHRNYLPALLMFWPLAVWLTKLGANWHVRLLLTLGILCGLGTMTYANARVWGNTTEQALLWSQMNPASPRAQSYAAQIMISRNQPAWAEARLRPLLKDAPNEIQIAFNLLGADCNLEGIPTNDLEATRAALLHTRRLGELSFQWLSQAITQADSNNCPGLTFPAIEGLLDAMWANPAVRSSKSWQQDVLNLRGKLALAQKQPEAAYRYFAVALAMRPNPAVALEQAAALGNAGWQALALCELELWEKQEERNEEENTASSFDMVRLHNWVLRHQDYWPREVYHLKAALSDDLPDDHEQGCPLSVQ